MTRAEAAVRIGYAPIAIPRQAPPAGAYGDLGPGVVIPLPKETQ